MGFKSEYSDEVCRVCLGNNDNLLSIFNIGSAGKISDDIEHCSGIKIIEADGFSSICECCFGELSICYNFLEKCRSSAKKIHEILKNRNRDDVVENTPLVEPSVDRREDSSHLSRRSESINSPSASIEHSDSEEKLPEKVSGRGRARKPSKATEERRHTCETCGKSFASSSNLRVHQRAHSGELPYACSQCERRFAQRGSLAAHSRRHSGERPFRCARCPASFAERGHLRRHRSVHSAERPFACAACGKAVKSAFALKQHLALHAARREHVCERCGAAFSVRGNLAAHVRALHSERSGQCPVCRRLVPDLLEHMPLHSGEKPHMCPDCGKSFSRRRGLLVHSRQHSAAGKFACGVEGCNQTFYAKWVLDCHVLKHTGNTPFTCKHCCKGFFRVCHLTKHLKLNHPDEDEKFITLQNITS